jgi:hypothetical protein
VILAFTGLSFQSLTEQPRPERQQVCTTDRMTRLLLLASACTRERSLSAGKETDAETRRA